MYNFDGGETEDKGYGRRYPCLVAMFMGGVLITLCTGYFLLFGDF